MTAVWPLLLAVAAILALARAVERGIEKGIIAAIRNAGSFALLYGRQSRR